MLKPFCLVTAVFLGHAILLKLPPQGRLMAQDANSARVLEFIPEQTLAVVSLWPEQLSSNESLRLLPLEVITASGIENIGLDPLKLSRVDLFIGLPDREGPQFGVLLQSSAPLDINQLNPEILDGNQPLADDDFEYVRLRSPNEIVIHQVDSNTAVIGTKLFAKTMVKSAIQKGEIASILEAVKTQQDALAIVSVNMLRPLLQGLVQGVPLPASLVDDVQGIIDATDFVAVRMLLGTEEKLQVVISTQDAASAADVSESMNRLLEFAQAQLTSQMKEEIPLDSAVGTAMHAYIDRAGGEIVGMLHPKQSDNRLVVELNDFKNASVIGTLTGLLLPAVQAARTAARRTQSSNNLKQLGLAMHNFADAYGALPGTAGLDDDGEPMISWRVAILPFIEEQALYNKFHLDEPWDSEHNLALLEEMPDVFKHPNQITKPGYTVYQAPVGEETLLRLKEPTKFREITDGTSNTIMLLETSSERAVPWSAPQDYELDMEDPTAGLFEREFAQFLFGDGSVQIISASIDLEVLKALFTRAGGEVVNRP